MRGRASLTALARPALLCGLAALAAGTSAAPESVLADPTRPAAPAAAARERPGAAPEPATPPRRPELQAVQVSPRGDSTALIDGRVVRLGERVGPLTLAAIDAQGVLLRGPRFEQRVSLLPGITKTASSAPPPGDASGVNLAAKEAR